MRNSRLFTNWLAGRKVLTDKEALKHLPMPDEDGWFWRGSTACVLPSLRVYWSAHDPEDPKLSVGPPWQARSWCALGSGYVRFMRIDQALECVEACLPDSHTDLDLARALARAISVWLIPVEDPEAAAEDILDSRIETVRLGVRRAEIYWSRDEATRFPDALRPAVAGLDPVHTPESSRAGLTRVVSKGWRINDAGALVAEHGAGVWGPSTALIPHRLHDAPRRLMLGASLLSHAVRLAEEDLPRNPPREPSWQPPGRNLLAAFQMMGGWTHEDAIVVSQSAAQKLTRHEVRSARVLIPAVASKVTALDSTTGPLPIRRGDAMVRVYVDAFALGLRRFDLPEDGVDDGWIELGLPNGLARIDGFLVDVRRRRLNSPLWKESITFRIERSVPVRVGDKLSTHHGIKGVVSRVLPSEEMPLVDSARAEIVFSQFGILRRGAFGQVREAGNARGGTVFVMRQRQDADAPERCRVRGAEQHGHRQQRGQRYGEMEFWALMAHGARDVAAELLDPARSTAHWMKCEAALGAGSHGELARQCLNRYFAVVGRKYEGGQLADLAPPLASAKTATIETPTSHQVEHALDLLKSTRHFLSANGTILLDLGMRVDVTLNGVALPPIDKLVLLPPWLRPSMPGRRHKLTRAYGRLIRTLAESKDDAMAVAREVSNCVRWAFDERSGAGGFLRREILGRRLTHTARAVIVPRPDLRADQIAIPVRVASILFEGLDSGMRQLVLVNRNPTLHRRGLIALRPVIDDRCDASVFGLPLAVLGPLGADFDGDQATVVALTTEAAFVAAEDLLPGAPSLRNADFRSSHSAFPLGGELAKVADGEEEMSSNRLLDQDRWCGAHHRIAQERIASLGDGWELAAVRHAMEDPDNQEMLRGCGEIEWLRRAQEEMAVIFRSVRLKGRLGGILRRQLYRMRFRDEHAFCAGVRAIQTVTERLTQSALKTKSGSGAKMFNSRSYYADPLAPRSVAALHSLDPTLQADALAAALGTDEDPVGFLSWLAKPTLKVLMAAGTGGASESHDLDPRIVWFLG